MNTASNFQSYHSETIELAMEKQCMSNRDMEWVDGKRMKRRLLAFGVANGQREMNAT